MARIDVTTDPGGGLELGDRSFFSLKRVFVSQYYLTKHKSNMAPSSVDKKAYNIKYAAANRSKKGLLDAVGSIL